jgi:AraC family transcriptional regulator
MVPPHVEICLVIAGNEEGLVRRNTAGLSQEAAPKTGAIWISPAGVDKDIAITAPIPQTMHLYIPAAQFDRLNGDFNLPFAPAHSICHAAGIEDRVIDQIGRSILSELERETAAGRMYVETASLMLAARLLQKYCDSGACVPADADVSSLDRARLGRALEYVDANIAGSISLADLAGAAGYSQFHFARKFKRAVGVSPHRYVSTVRLERAMAELALGKLPIAEIALNARFSSQASFTRAFRRSTGMTPKTYQRQRH